MNKKIRWIIVVLISIVILVSIGTLIIQNKKLNNKIVGESWDAYFAPSYTDISYGNTKAQMVRFDKLGNVEIYDEIAYPFSSSVNYKDEIIYQNSTGLGSLNSKNNENNILADKKTVGYNMSDVIEKKELFYFLLNESFKDDYYSSQILIGDEENQKLHQIEGFVNGYGDDEESIYLLTSDMKDRYLKQIQKISVDSQGEISIKKNDIIFDTIIGSDNKMIVVDGYIYCFSVKEHYSVSMLKISADTLELESVTDLIKFDSEENNDKYYAMSPSSIFYNEGKIYYPMLSGDVYSFDIKTNNFVKEFSIKDYTFNLDANIRSYYSTSESEISFLYYENEKDKYCLSTYSLDGTSKDNTYLDKLKMNSKMYPHSFIKSNK